MEALLKRELGLSFVGANGQKGEGWISDGLGYNTDKGQIFAKINKKKEAKVMFDGEFASLEAIIATDTVRVPKPMKVMDHPTTEGAVFAMEHLDMRGLSTYAAKLGEQLARMHLFNEELMKQKAANESRVGGGCDVECVTRFGFPVATCCGIIPQDNEWCDNWVAFYARNRLKFHLDVIERDYGDREARELWPQLERRIPALFEGLEIKPALLHGDLHANNVGETISEPVIFDPASFYGHSEYELSIDGMYGGFSRSFYSAYHKLIPKAAGFDRRHELYKLFHYLNHWNHFGSEYRQSTISTMKSIIK